MVVATQKGRRYPTLTSACSSDPLARSLHKEVDYSPLNVSRRSPDQDVPNLGPDCRYPTLPGQRKRQNTLVDTGWHACVKNNNYVFVRNPNGISPDSERMFGEKWKENNDADVTFIISTTKPEDEGKGEKLVVALQDPKKNKVRRGTPSPTACEDLPSRKTSLKTTNGSTGKRSEKKRTPNWLKRLRTPGRNRSLKIEATEEETTNILDPSPEESPESSDLISPDIISSSALKKALRDLPTSPKNISNAFPQREETPSGSNPNHMPSKGPQTSTPKDNADGHRTSKSLPRKFGTPYRPLDGRLSVRRRIPYETMTPESTDDSPLMVAMEQTKKSPKNTPISPILEAPVSPIRKSTSPRTSGDHSTDSDIISSRLLRSSNHSDKLNSQNNATPDSASQKSSSNPIGGLFQPQMESRLHPSSSNMDIPYADCEENVSFDDPRSRKSRRERGRVCKSSDDISSPQKEITDRKSDSVPLLRSTSSDVSTSTHRKLKFSSEASIVDCEIQRETPMSPMEEEENMSLDQCDKPLISFDDSTVTFSPYAPAKRETRDSPISCWLQEIRLLTESECLHALQAKELVKEDWIPNALAVGNAQETCEKIWDLGCSIESEVGDMMEALKSDAKPELPWSVMIAQFCSSLVDLLKMTHAVQYVGQAELRIRKACAGLLDNFNKGEQGDKDWKSKTKSDLEGLQKVAQIIVRQLLMRELQVIVDCVERAENINNLKRSVFAIILLGRMNATFCEIIAKLGAVRSLLAICVESKWQEMHPCVLRALTVLSCVPTAIRSFEESDGVDCVCDILCDAKAEEGARSEAAGLVAQITAPWTEGSGYVLKSITQNSDKLVAALAGLSSVTENSEVFLLSSAALANLSFADDALRKMRAHQVLEILVTACRNKTHAASLFIKDQVATVLANMAAKEEYRGELSTGGSLVLLLCLLQLRPCTGHGPPQLAACERIQQKAAIALARLCTDPDTSNVVAEMQGIQRLVKLCKDRKERNDSDSVLVACLAALRKIAAVRQKEEFAKLGARELVEPRLWDAFLAHSSKRESFV